MKVRTALLVLPIFLVTACGEIQYVPPDSSVEKASNSVVVQAPFDQAWSHAIPQLGKSFFAINTIDKGSGILNISYSGDPEQFVDCGTIHSEFGSSTFDFPAAKAEEQFLGPSGINPPQGQFDRRMSLDGRMNIVFERAAAGSTKVTVNTLYVVSRRETRQACGVFGGCYGPVTFSDSMTFNTGGEGAFADGTTCRAKGSFEQAILSMVTERQLDPAEAQMQSPDPAPSVATPRVVGQQKTDSNGVRHDSDAVGWSGAQ
jgi:hypothetical protein